MKRRPVQPETLRFVLIAIVFMLITDQFIFGGKRSYIEDAKEKARIERLEKMAQDGVEPVRVEPPEGEFFEMIPEVEEEAELPVMEPLEEPVEEPVPEPENETTEESALPDVIKPAPKGTKIAIVIDDLGMNVKNSKRIIDLPAPITLAFLPYAQRTRELAAGGTAKGHELIIHTPMEAMDGALNIGPGGLKAAMSASEFDAAFGVMLSSFDGYVGINNHMGSRLTQDRVKMGALMKVLDGRKLFFLDSKTIEASVVAKEAAKAGVPYAERDVFLDHVESRAFVDKALAQTEAVARRKGYAIAIGHPKDVTIEGLQAWLPTLAAKGIELVPVSALLTRPKVVAAMTAEAESEIAPSVDMFPEYGNPLLDEQ